MSKLKAGILGATGLVGQRFVQFLADHPWFELSALIASPASAGRPYRQAVSWRLEGPMPALAADMPVRQISDGLPCDLIFSSVAAEVAAEAEPALARAGFAVISNASAFRMHPHVPLIVPEINLQHVQLLTLQREACAWRGCLVTNPNCLAIQLALALAPLHARWGLERVFVVTMQAMSGAGLMGLPGLDILDNVIPYIAGEESKIEREPQKILGDLASGRIAPAGFRISAMANRVAVAEGHLASVSVALRRSAGLAAIKACLRDFRGFPQIHDLPSAPQHPLIVLDEHDRPQPKRDRLAGGGMAVTIGNIRPCPVLDFKFSVLGHNTIRGAAGSTLLIAESMHRLGLLA